MAETIKGLRIEKATVLRYMGKEAEIILPKDVLRIAPFAFAGCKTLRKIVVPYTLCSIGKGAFFGCDNLEEATIPGRLYKRAKGGKVFPKDANIYFRFYATMDAPLEDDDYSDYFDTLDAYLASGIRDEDMFDAIGRFGGYVVLNSPPAPAPKQPEEGTPVKDIKEEPVKEAVPDEDAAKKPEKLIWVNEPDGGEDEWEIIEEVDEVEEEETEPHEDIDLDADEYVETLEEKMEAVIPTDDKSGAVVSHRNLINTSDYLIEDDKVIKYIGSASVTKVPEFIRTIGEDAFSNSDVEEVELPEQLTTIGKNAFAWCNKLRQINLPETLTLIDDGAFASCRALEKIALPASLLYIGADAFRACSGLKEIQLPQSVKTISRRAFDFCVSIETVVLPDGLTVLSEGVFSHCENLQKVVLPQGLKAINAWAFADCYQLRTVNFPDSLEEIGAVAFLNCRSLVAFDLPQSVKRIGRQAFVGCTSLHLVNLPVRLEKQLKPQRVFYKLPSVRLEFYGEDTTRTDG